ISIDDDKNEAVIETMPGTKLRVHRQTISRVIDPVEAQEDVIEEPAGASLNEDHAIQAGEPLYGERTEDKPKRAPRKKATE
ncbi:MAG: preprotein translocase subunit YajC, partial [Pseudolysinimonas sp.]